jgi:hypothetical protein
MSLVIIEVVYYMVHVRFETTGQLLELVLRLEMRDVFCKKL